MMSPVALKLPRFTPNIAFFMVLKTVPGIREKGDKKAEKRQKKVFGLKKGQRKKETVPKALHGQWFPLPQ